MAGDGFDEKWAMDTARWTFIYTAVGVVLFVGAVFLFIF
jgi:hypothetical protein